MRNIKAHLPFFSAEKRALGDHVKRLARDKENTVGTDENLFRLVPVPEHGARSFALELVPVFPYPGAVPKLVLGRQKEAMFRLGHQVGFYMPIRIVEC